MKAKIILTTTILVMTLLFSSCVTSYDHYLIVTCDELNEYDDSISGIMIEVGDKIRVELCSNPTTGFEWDYAFTIDNVVREEDHDFEEPSGDVVGAAGTEYWTFEAIEKGDTEILMEYSRPWEDGEKVEWTYEISITVE